MYDHQKLKLKYKLLLRKKVIKACYFSDPPPCLVFVGKFSKETIEILANSIFFSNLTSFVKHID